MSWIAELFAPQERSWESFYRNRWASDKVVRSTHGVNCTGSCSWNVHVKQGIVTWEMQALDYPRISRDLPPYEPRGCQRGISYSWYVYSPLRIKYPTIRGALLDLWRAAKAEHAGDLVAAWDSIVNDPSRRKQLQQARGKGGFRRAHWDEALEIIAAANIHTVKKYGPDRLVGFSPIPAMSMVSYAAGARFMQLMGGVSLSFYDWYCDLPPASPEIWGEQTDVAESADWYRSAFVAIVGSNVLMTRTPDAHFLVEVRHRGTRVVVFAPDFNQTAKVADEWVPLHEGQDAAFWLATTHVILKEFFVDRQVPYFVDYLRKYSDAPFLVTLNKRPDGTYDAGALLRASQIERTRQVENADWKYFVLDETTGEPRMPKGAVGHRWQAKKGEWNLKLEDGVTGEPIVPALWLREHDEVVALNVPDFTDGISPQTAVRSVPVKRIRTVDGECWVTTGLELLLATYGVDQGHRVPGRDTLAWPTSYDDADGIYTPAWQEKLTGVAAADVIRFAREWASTAEKTEGRCSIIMGAGANHWYHNNLIYRSCIVPLVLCGCVGKNGGGWNHYVGQEKLVPVASWAAIAFGTDWGGPPRLQNTPSFHYMHSDQWRYDRPFTEMCPTPDTDHPMATGHTADKQALAVRSGWLPCYPQFNESNFDVIAKAKQAGASTPEAIVEHVVGRMKARDLKFSMEDPNNPQSYPRVWYIWRGNAIASSAKGHEYFLKHYLGTHHNSIAEEEAKGHVRDVVWHDQVELGKMDLIVDLNFRMDTSALYSDIVLPTATYYEKDDLNTTDMHSFIHPLQAAIPPCWEAKSDWAIFRDVARATSDLAKRHLPDPQTDLVASPLLHDTPAEIAQLTVRDWAKGECEALPGKTMSNMALVTRDYPRVYEKFVTLGPKVREGGLGAHGIRYDVSDVFDDFVSKHPTNEVDGRKLPSLYEDRSVCEAILAFAAETHGELGHRAFAAEGAKTGMDLSHLAADTRGVRYSFDDLCSAPRRVLNSPFWSGDVRGERTYAAFCQNVEELTPWRTQTGRQHLYLDHEAYRAFGENLPVYKPRAGSDVTRDLVHTRQGKAALVLNYLTPHGKWHIHSTYGDTLRMETLSRGIEPIWLSERDAEAAGIVDNDWVEVHNDHGTVVTRACVSARIPKGICFIYHATERTIGVPRSPSRDGKRAGAHNSLTRTRLKPLFMIGGYAQFTYAFNYWGPQGINRETFVVIEKLDRPQW